MITKLQYTHLQENLLFRYEHVPKIDKHISPLFPEGNSLNPDVDQDTQEDKKKIANKKLTKH